MLNQPKFVEQLFQPTLTPILKNRPISISITLFAATQSLLALGNIPGWICPTRNYLGCPCPGCGLTRAMTALISGDFSTMAKYHALAPFFLIGLSIVALAAFLPTSLRQRFLKGFERWETKTGGVGIFLVIMVFYWLIRLIFFNQSYLDLILS